MTRTILKSALLAILSAGSAQAADNAPPVPPPGDFDDRRWEFSVSSEARMNSWSGSRGTPTSVPSPGRGRQYYAPLSIQATGRPHDDFKLELQMRTGVVKSKQSTIGAQGEVATVTDTSGVVTMTYYGFSGWQPFLSVALNAPTGRAALLGSRAAARMDSELVDIPVFGEGFNIGPTVGATVALGETAVVTVSGGATVRGSYDRETLLGTTPPFQKIGPSDVFTGMVNYVGQFGALTLSATASYATETATALQGQKLLQSGDRFTLTANALYQWSENWRSMLGLSWLHTMRNKVLDPNVSALLREAFNSNANVLRANFEHLYSFGDWSVGPTASVLHRDRNGWNPTALQFAPAKTRWAAGLTGTYRLNESVSFNARVEHIWVRERANPDKIYLGNLYPGSGVVPVSQHGFAAALGSTVRF